MGKLMLLRSEREMKSLGWGVEISLKQEIGGF